MFEMLPYTFIRIEIRSIGREPFYMDQSCPATRQKRLDLFSAMDFETIPNDQQFPAQVLSQMLKKQCAIPTGQRTPAFHSGELYGPSPFAHDPQIPTRD